MILIKLIHLYQKIISPWVGDVCRYHPSCSHYAQDALKEWGILKGSWLTVRRILKCNPFGGYGFDFVPRRKNNGEDDGTRTRDLRRDRPMF